ETGLEQFDQVVLQSREINLSLWISESRVKLQHLRAVSSQHDARIQDATEINALGGRTLEPWLENPRANLRQCRLGQKRSRRVSAHAAGVQALVAVQGALVVLGRRKQHGRLAVAKRMEGNLRPFQELLDNDGASSSAKYLVDEDVVDGPM